jgi:PKD repeat protein
VTTSFTADLVGDYELKLTVSDGKGGSDTKTVNITATNTPPIAKASADKTAAFIGDLVHLDGSGSSDANGDPLTYLWAPAAAPTTPLLDENGNTCPTSDPCSKREKITIRPSVAGTYVLNLTVNDGYEINTNTDTNTVTITVTQGTGSITVTW